MAGKATLPSSRATPTLALNTHREARARAGERLQVGDSRWVQADPPRALPLVILNLICGLV